MEKYTIKKDSVQETLIIPLVGRKYAADKFPELISDPTAAQILERIDYDFESKTKTMESAMGTYGALEAAQRAYDMEWEIKDYLKGHPCAAVVNMGCGLDNIFDRVDNGTCTCYNLDYDDVIAVRNEVIAPSEREKNIACDLNDTSWFDEIDDRDGVIFAASGVFYYFTKANAKKLFVKLAGRFPGGVLVFDACNKTGLKMMLSSWIRTADIKDVGAYFDLSCPEKELAPWSGCFAKIETRSYMNGYRQLKNVRLLFKLLNWVADHIVKMNIVKITFAG